MVRWTRVSSSISMLAGAPTGPPYHTAGARAVCALRSWLKFSLASLQHVGEAGFSIDDHSNILVADKVEHILMGEHILTLV